MRGLSGRGHRAPDPRCLPPSPGALRVRHAPRAARVPQVTAQCRENQVEQYKPLFMSMLKSFVPPPKQTL